MNFTLPIRFGIAASGSLIAYFLILSLFNLHTNVFYSLFNGVITGFAIYEAIKYDRIQNREAFNYGKGFKTGLITGFVATLIFTVFLHFMLQKSTRIFSRNYQKPGLAISKISRPQYSSRLPSWVYQPPWCLRQHLCSFSSLVMT